MCSSIKKIQEETQQIQMKTYDANFLSYNSKQIAIMERDTRNAALEPDEVQGGPRQSILVRVTSIRKRLLDEDNLCEKYHVDLCRYAGVISGDEAGQTKIEVAQRKAAKGETEKTIIEVFAINQPTQ